MDQEVKISKSLLLQLAENNSFSEEIIKKEFPQLFEKELELNKWMKTPFLGLYCPDKKTKEGFMCYGFSPLTKTWIVKEVPLYATKNDIPATEQEVFEALKKEAIKKYNGRIFKSLMTNTEIKFIEPSHFNMKENSLWVDGYNIFKDGVWSAVILEETYVKVPLSEIKRTPNDMQLGAFVRGIAENY